MGLAAGLVHSHIDVILAPASTEVEPARQATQTISIVFAQHADPVGVGHVESLAHPGGNITGISMVLTEFSAKALEIFKDAVPHASHVGVLWNPTTPSHVQVLKTVQLTADRLVARFNQIDGYRCLSLVRALAVVKCQSALA